MKKLVVTTHLKPEVVAQIDEARKIEGLSRYAWIANAITARLEKDEK